MLAIVVLFLGKYLNKKVGFFRNYNIPEPVTGGVLVSLLLGLLFYTYDVVIEFDMRSRDILLIVFFTCIGLSAKFSSLREGGKSLVVLSIAAISYLFLQNLTGIGVTRLTDLDSSVGVLGGSVSLSGGHGTAIAWSSIFVEQYGIAKAAEIGIACATFGLILGGLIGGPIAKHLIVKNQLQSDSHENLSVGLKYKDEHRRIDVESMLVALFFISLAVGVGIHLNKLFVWLGLQLPDFVTSLFAGIVLTNTIPVMARNISWPAGTATLALVSDLSLSLFLAMSLMSLQIWTLIDLAAPILMILIAQLIVISSFVVFVVFRIMGRDYDAAVISSGYAGLALGATPTAIANMTAVTKKFGASSKAFIVVPLVGAFFIDIANALIIQFMLERVG